MSTRRKSKTSMKHRKRSNSTSSATITPTNPFASCGPLDNEFLEFYADLHKSAILYSDKQFQQQILYPPPCLPSTKQIPKPKSNIEIEDEDNFDSEDPVKKVVLTPHTALGGSGSRLLGSKSLGFSSIGGSSVRRKVSFSKHSPRRNLITPTPPSTTLVPQMAKMKIIPRITVQDSSSCWSSDLDETDTTETEKASSSDDFDDDSDLNTPTKLEREEPMMTMPDVPNLEHLDATG